MRSGDAFTLASQRSIGARHWAALGLAVLSCTVAADVAPAQDCGTWFPVPGGGTTALGVASGGGQFVAVGTLGAQTSPDGVAWTLVPLGLGGGALVRAGWNGSLWVAVGQGGRIYTSPTGATWTVQVSSTTRNLEGVAWGNSVWVAVGDLQTILTSSNGTDWTKVHDAASGYLTSVIWNGAAFAAVGQGGAVLTSSDGTTWSPSAIAGEDWLTDITWVGGQFVVVAFDGTVLTRNAFSPWAVRAETGAALRRIVWTGGRYIAVGDQKTILASPDTVTWGPETVTGTVPTGSLTGLTWNGSRAIIVGAPTGVLRSDCGVYADFTIDPTGPQIGQTINVSATTVQGMGRARWDFGEVGCDGTSPIHEMLCLTDPCNFATNFAYATAGEKTISLYGRIGSDGSGAYMLVRKRTLTVAPTGTCATCAAPGVPTTPTPANSAVLPGGSVLLQWGAPATGTPPFTYDVELDGGTLCAGTAATQCPASGVVESATPHLWHVTAKNACGEKTSPAWSFLACSAPGLPAANFDWQPAGPLPTWPAQQQPFVGQEVMFHDLSTNDPGDWVWSGLTASGLLSGPDPRVTWWAPGNRSIALRAANCLGWSDEGTKSVTVFDDVRPRLWAFDFGTDTSPVAAGFTRVTATTIFTPALGYGWLSGVIVARERTTGSDLVRDFVFTQNATFVVAVPNRVYDVTVWLGDTGRPHDEMAVYLQGDQVDQVTTATGEVAARVFRVAVIDGRLTVRIADLGGADPNAVVNGLEIVPADPLHVDFGTAGSPVAAGYRRVSEVTGFKAPAWCGWSAGKIGSRDRTSGSDLLRDFDVTQDGTFSCAVGSGVWDATVVMGDATSAHDQMGVFLEGLQVDSVTRPAGQFATRHYRIAVADGRVTLRLADLGGSDVNAVINSLDAVRVGPFDFGTATSPVAAGYVGVAATARYSGVAGFGWLEGIVGARDRGVGNDLLRDFNMTTAATFAVDVPNGAYDVTVVMGDATSAHDQMAIALEGVQVGVIGTAKGKVVSRTYRATVADGQLTVRLEDHGGSDANVVIDGLSLAPVR